MIAFTVVFLIPFATFYYGLQEFDLFEDTTPASRKKKKCAQFCGAMFYESFVAAIFSGMLIALYFTRSQTNIPVTQLSASFSDLETLNYLEQPGASPYDYISQTLSANEILTINGLKASVTYISYDLNFAIYCTAFFGFIGFWIFAFFAGAGLTALPLDLVLGEYVCIYIYTHNDT
jgi:hypothetical protein